MAVRIRWFPFGFAAMATAVSLPFAWLLASYLRDFDVPPAAAALVGLMMVPAALVVAALLFPIVFNWRHRRRASHMPLERLADADLQDPAALMVIGDRMQAFDRGPLVRVIGVGQVQEASEVQVELLAIEVREVGAQLTLRLRGGERRRSHALRPRFPHPDVQLSDDAGTTYVAFPGGGGGGDGIWRYEVRFFPAPPADVRRLEVTVPTIVDSLPFQPAAGPMIEGPWRFEVEL